MCIYDVYTVQCSLSSGSTCYLQELPTAASMPPVDVRISLHSAINDVYVTPGRGTKYCDECVSLSVCLSVRLSVSPLAQLAKSRGRTLPNFCARCLWPWLGLPLTLYTSGFMDDYVFIPWSQWARIKHDVMFRGVRQVAVPVKRQATTVFG